MQDFPPFRLDPSNQSLWRRRQTAPDERILLPPKAFAVLRYLVAHAAQLVTQDEILAAVRPETHVQPEVLKSRIFEVRSALGDRPKTPRPPPGLPQRTVPRPWREETPEALPYPILRRLSRPRHAEEPRVRMAYTMYVDQHLSVADICQTLRISQATFYRYVALGRRAAEGLR